jgi:hypothetical protein
MNERRNTIYQHPGNNQKRIYQYDSDIVDYSGVEIHLMFSPSNYHENNLYMAIAMIARAF